MGILYRQEHVSCHNYATLASSFFTVVSLKKDEILQRQSLSVSLLVFVSDGCLDISTVGCMNYRIGTGQFFLLVKGTSLLGKAREDAELLICVISGELKLCSRFSLQQLQEYVPFGYNYRFFSLDFTPRMHDFVRMLTGALKDGLGCIHYHQLKRDELLLYLRAEYPKEQLAVFFLSVIGASTDFKEFVLMNYRQVKGVKELAVRANLSLSTFNRRFKETFKKPAQEWLTVRKTEDVLKDILMSTFSFAEIAEKHNFSSTSYLISFCKKHFGKTPSDLRKNGIAPGK